MAPIVILGTAITTKDEYVRVQRKVLSKARLQSRPSTEKPAVLVEDDGLMRVRCVCGNYPIVLVDAKLACCLLCGLVYEGLDVAEDVT